MNEVDNSTSKPYAGLVTKTQKWMYCVSTSKVIYQSVYV